MLSFNPTFSLSSFTLIKRLFSSSLLSAIRVVSSAYLRLLIFLPAILIPACASSSLAFHTVCSACKLNKQGDSIQPWHTLFPIWKQPIVPSMKSVACWSAYRFLRRQVRWSGIPTPRMFHSLLWSTRLKALVLSVKQSFLEFSCFFHDPMDVGHLMSGSSVYSKSSLYLWKLLVHILLKPSLKDFEHYHDRMLNECSCEVVWRFFSIAFLRDWNENWPFPVLWPLLSFPNLQVL